MMDHIVIAKAYHAIVYVQQRTNSMPERGIPGRSVYPSAYKPLADADSASAFNRVSALDLDVAGTASV